MTYGYLAVLFLPIGRIGPNFDHADPLFALVKTPGFYLQYVEVADEDPAKGIYLCL